MLFARVLAGEKHLTFMKMTRFHRLCALAVALAGASGAVWPQPPKSPPLLRDPSVSQTQIAFSYAGHIWSASRDGRDVRQLTNGKHEEKPLFSPDGTRIAFTGTYDDGRAVYVMPASGGTPRRLTYHPADLAAVGWTPDGRRILFSSRRAAFAAGVVQLFSVAAEGGFATPVPLVRAAEASFSPDGARLAYVPNLPVGGAWKRYRGGRTRRILIAHPADSSIESVVPRDNSNDFNPMWVGEKVYFLSDRDGPVGLYSYDLISQEVVRVVKNDGLDLKSASASHDTIAYEQFGSLHLLDLKSGADRLLDIRPAADLVEAQPHFLTIEPRLIRSAALSPTGANAVFGARGEIITVPAGLGAANNLTRTTDVVERDPAWSPDGRSIAYFSDESGEYALHVRDQSGIGDVRKINLGHHFYFSPVWSADSTKVAYADNRLNYWYVDVEKKRPVRLDTATYTDPAHGHRLTWSPDGRWIVYTKQLANHLHALFAYSLERAQSYQLTDGMSDVLYACFDRSGEYLYFTASTDVGLSSSSREMSRYQRPVTRNVYAVVLGKNLEIDSEAISQQILSLPIPIRNYQGLFPGKSGVLFLLEAPAIDSLDLPPGDSRRTRKVHTFDLKTRKTQQILDEVGAFDVAFSGETILYSKRSRAARVQWLVAPAEKPTEGERPLALESTAVYVDPRAEWKHMYQQVWRNEREFFYDPGLHGLDLETARKRYEPYLESLATRDDLNYLFTEMLGNMTVGHMLVRSADRSEPSPIKTGFLGADYAAQNGRYRFARIYRGDHWNPNLRGPLAQVGVDVKVGEYLLEIDGREAHCNADLYSFFEGTAGRPVALKVGPRADGAESRSVTVVPIEDELPLRNFAWIEANRRRVDELSGGRVAYVYLPDTAARGYASFNRYYFGQVGKEAAVIDARDNSGGDVADYIIDYLRRPLLNYWHMNVGKDIATPLAAIFGPKAMIINEMVGSGGDSLAWMFRKAEIGPLVGRRTGGYLVGLYTNPADLLDGGYVATPSLAFYNPEGTWDIENHGVSPDFEVEDDPKAARAGHDPQLEKAVEVVMDRLKRHPAPTPRHPAYPNYQTNRMQ